MKCIYLLNLIACIAISIPMHAELSPVDLKGMSACMQPGYEHLAPAVGAIFWESPLIRNLYKFGNESNGMIQLIKNIFAYNIDGVTFDTTNSYLKIARYLTPEDIGTIIGTIQQYMSTEKNEKKVKELEKKVFDVIRLRKEDSKKYIKQTIITELQNTINRQKQQIVSFAQKMKADSNAPIPDFLDALIAGTIPDKALINKLSVLLAEPLGQTYKPDLQSLINISQQLLTNSNALKQEEKTKKEIYNNFFNTNARTGETKNSDGSIEFSLYKSIMEAVKEESNGVYPQGFTIDILLAWLWRHTSAQDDLKSYLGALAKSLGTQDSQIFSWPNHLEQFTINDYERLKTKTAEEINQLPFDQLLFAFTGYNLYDNPLPPLVEMTSAMEYHASNGNSYTEIPDCAETALRNFFNALFYNSQTKQFDIALLKSLNADAKLINYYIVNNSSEKINTLLAHNDWANVVSELQGVQYRQDDVVEISAGITNILNVIKQLIPGADSFDALADKLNAHGIEMQWDPQQPIANANTGNAIEFTIQQPETNQFQITWIFYSNHAQIELLSNDKSTHLNSYEEALKLMANSASKSMRFADITLYALFEENMESIITTISTLSDSEEYELVAPFFRPLDNHELIKSTEYLANQLNTSKNPSSIMKIITKIHNAFPRDNFSLIQFFSAVIDYSNPSRIELANELLTLQQDRVGRVSFLKTVLKSEIPQDIKIIESLKPLYKWAHDILLTLTSDSDKLAAISSILGQSITPENKELLNPLYDWATATLPSLINDYQKTDIISKILDKKISSPEDREILKGLYKIANKSLRTLVAAQSKLIAISFILNKSVTSEDIELLKPLYEWVTNTLPSLIDERDKLSAILSILGQSITRENKELLKPLYDWITKTLPSLKNNQNKLATIKFILNKKILPEKDGTLLIPLYEWIISNLPYFIQDWDKAEIIKVIINKNITSSDERKLYSPLYIWVNNTLPTITNNSAKNILADSIVNKNIISPESNDLLKPLYEWLTTILPTLQRSTQKDYSNNLLEHKTDIDDLLTPEQWQQVEQIAK